MRSQHQAAMDKQDTGVLLSRDTLASDPLSEWKSRYNEYWLEVGFGGGEHLAHQAQQFPHVGFIGCEPFINGVAKLLVKLDAQHSENAKIFQDDVREILPRLTHMQFTRVHILFPDPWPKTRHHKRRLIQPEFLQWLKTYLKPAARIRLATDHSDYARQMLETFLADRDFMWTAQDHLDWSQRFSDSIKTRYEAKLLGDIAPVFLEFVYRS